MKKLIFSFSRPVLIFAFCAMVLTGCNITKTQPELVEDITGAPVAVDQTDQNTQTLPANSQANRPMMGQESFGLAVCDEVPKSLVEKTLGLIIFETEDLSSSDGTSCSYFTNQEKTENVLVKVTYLEVETQKNGQEMLGRTVTTNSSIPMDHFIALQEDGQINAIYLVMAPEKYVRVDRTSKTVTNDQLIELAKQVALIILG